MELRARDHVRRQRRLEALREDAAHRARVQRDLPPRARQVRRRTRTQYRSGIYTFDDAQAKAAEASRAAYQQALGKAGHGPITTEIKPAPEFYYAEDYHQQYLGKNPRGYCGLGGTGVSCPIGLPR